MGHLFIVRGDLLRLRCDAIALTGDARQIGPRWTAAETVGPYQVPDDLKTILAPEKHRPRDERCAHIGTWRTIELFRLNTGGRRDGSTGINWYVSGAEAFVDAAMTHLSTRPSKGRPWTIALPVLGVGGGGAVDADVARVLVPALVRKAQSCAGDVVLVCASDDWFAAAQMARARVASAFASLGAEHEAEATRLAAAFDEEHKPVFFVGAGVSIGAGLPGWAELLRDVSGLTSDQERAEFNGLAAADPLAAADVIARRLGEDRLAQLVKERLAPDAAAAAPGLGHMLIAALPAEGYVTTNFDCLLENALTIAGNVPPTVLPGTEPRSGARWILKLHGTIGDEKLVLSRTNFLRFDAASRSLLSLVEASILLRHLVVVGFSFTDPNFLRAVDSVRQAMQQADRPHLFTGLVVGPPGAFRQHLWPDARFIDFGEPSGTAARQQLIFFDRLNALVAPAAHLLQDTFRPFLTPEEARLADGLRSLKALLPADGNGHAALRRVLRSYEGGK